MAFTVTKVDKQSVGARLAVTLEVTADAATHTIGSVDTGMKIIDYFQLGVQSAATGHFHVGINVDAVGAASNGAIAVTGIASGDQFFITVYGR